MSFENHEGSRFGGAPCDLYLFRYGSTANAYYAYTDAEHNVVFGGIDYQPIPISRDTVKGSGTLDKSAFNVSVPIDAAISNLFRVYPPGQPVTLIVRQGHLTDPDDEFLVVWSGRVLQVERTGSEATLTCEPISTSMRRTGLRRHYQLGCPHVLYGPQCRANKIAATTSHRIISLDATRITLQDGWSGSINPDKYLGGMVEWVSGNGPESRTILRVVDFRTLVLSGPTTGLVAGQFVDTVLGCNHQMGVGPQPEGDCLPLHNNIHNFGGQPWIPFSNPINTNPFS